MIRRVIGRKKPLFCIVSQRPVEWLCSLVMIVIAAILLLPGRTFSLPSYAAVVADGISETQAIVFFGGIGIVRMCALMAGGLRNGARIRQIGAFSGGLAFIIATASVATPYFTLDQPMPVVSGVFAVLAIFEGYSIQIAGCDRRYGS